VSAFPLVVEGRAVTALVVGGGAVAARKARALAEAGATVRVIAPTVSEELRALADGRPVSIEQREYAAGDIADATLVVAATDSRAVNARVAADAHELRRLVNVADAPHEGSFATAAVHRAGDLVIAVTAGGVPGAAARIRDAIAERFDGRYASALAALIRLRRRTLGAGGGPAWREQARTLLGPDFCAVVESGAFDERVAAWR
jgi:precorrin-2 dehydrogenase / sirohydrochlorin ferrochelatase